MCNIRATSMESINYRSRHCSDYSLSFLMGFIFLLFLKWNRIHLLFFKFTRKRWFMVDQGRNDIIIPRSISVHLLQLNFINGFLMGTQKKKYFEYQLTLSDTFVYFWSLRASWTWINPPKNSTLIWHFLVFSVPSRM